MQPIPVRDRVRLERHLIRHAVVQAERHTPGGVRFLAQLEEPSIHAELQRVGAGDVADRRTPRVIANPVAPCVAKRPVRDSRNQAGLFLDPDEAGSVGLIRMRPDDAPAKLMNRDARLEEQS
jgi:hypothetical protein